MTSQEFETYLQSIGGLINGWKPDDIITERGYFSIGDGWLGITKKLIEDLIAIGWDKKIYQVKEKFGGGRFYTDGLIPEMEALIRNWEQETYRTCENCGTKVNVETTGKHWIKTVCVKCR